MGWQKDHRCRVNLLKSLKISCMYLTKKTYVKPDMKLSGLFFENPYMLLMMEHFNLNFLVYDKSVKTVCAENSINTNIFIDIANLYNGFNELDAKKYSKSDILTIVNFLNKSHNYYKDEKYPQIQGLIEEISAVNETKEIKLIAKFFDEYFDEVVEHLDYEDQVAFPYFLDMLTDTKGTKKENGYSAKIYSDHHTDIESKLMELKNLLLRHITIEEDSSLRRRLVISLFELDYDLNIHYLIEESALIPLVVKIENRLEK